VLWVRHRSGVSGSPEDQTGSNTTNHKIYMKHKLLIIVGALSMVGAVAAYANGFKCTFCNGTGFNGSFNCSMCKGSGRVNY
jgi:DnaJ-class molecular chaperone